MSPRDAWTSMGGAAQQFPLTRWSLLQQAKDPDADEQRAALEDLARAYWKPLYCFLRAEGRANEEAKDLVQGFFAALLDEEKLRRFDPAQGRFRTWLLACLKRFLGRERARDEAQKRGGGKRTVSLDDDGESQYREMADRRPDPQAAFERSWAADKLGRAVARVRGEFEREGRSKLVVVLDAYLKAENPNRPGYREFAAASGLDEDGVRHGLERIRKALRTALLDEVRPETDGERTAQEEAAHLLSCIGA